MERTVLLNALRLLISAPMLKELQPTLRPGGSMLAAACVGCVIEGGNSYLPTSCGQWLSAVNTQEAIAAAQLIQA